VQVIEQTVIQLAFVFQLMVQLIHCGRSRR
jgi:hypothetical protein